MGLFKLSLILSFLVVFAFGSVVGSGRTIRMFTDQKRSVARVHDDDDDVNRKCESWKFSLEVNNIRTLTVPKECVKFVQNYLFLSDGTSRYYDDMFYVAERANEFAETVKPTNNGKDVWIFDIDETLLSNLPYYAKHEFGSDSFNETDYNEWVEEADAPPLFYSLFLYKGLQIDGFKVILLTGRDESARSATERNLLRNSYTDWEKLIMRGPEDQGKEASVYKSEKIAELVKEGYIIHGNVGDQWSDLLGSPSTTRNFKIPNPLYYIP